MLRDEPEYSVSRPAEVLEIEICDFCEKENEELSNFNSFIVCKECLDEMNESQESYEDFDRCIFCDWPINRKTSGNVVKEYLKIASKWLEERNEIRIIKVLKGRMKEFVRKGVYSCRYDLLDYIAEIIGSFRPKLKEEFKERFVEKFDFKGSMIT